ncbi:MAG: FAD-binding oxidoreductase, partial [Clostridiales bacterium]|nr:FAD-binding oxidoreductase [Clostridiales bacterium]
GLKVPGQFELNPVKYLNFLISALQKDGMPIFQNTAAKTVEKEGDLVKVLTQDGHTVTCNHLVIATAYPFFEGGGMYFTRLEASRSYLTAFPITQAADDEYMMISSGEDTYSLRFSDTDGVKYLLVGGQGHKVGQADSEIDSYNRLILFARSHFEVDEPAFRWSAQDYKSLDSIPYIGRLTAKHHHIFTATGFNKWGMSNGSFAALLMTDLIRGKESKYEELFSPHGARSKRTSAVSSKPTLMWPKNLSKAKQRRRR